MHVNTELTSLERLNLIRAIKREMDHLTSTYVDNYPDCPKCARRYKGDIAERLSVLEAAASKLSLRVEPKDDWRDVITNASVG